MKSHMTVLAEFYRNFSDSDTLTFRIIIDYDSINLGPTQLIKTFEKCKWERHQNYYSNILLHNFAIYVKALFNRRYKILQ